MKSPRETLQNHTRICSTSNRNIKVSTVRKNGRLAWHICFDIRNPIIQETLVLKPPQPDRKIPSNSVGRLEAIGGDGHLLFMSISAFLHAMLAKRRPTPLMEVRANMIFFFPSTFVFSRRRMCWKSSFAIRDCNTPRKKIRQKKITTPVELIPTRNPKSKQPGRYKNKKRKTRFLMGSSDGELTMAAARVSHRCRGSPGSWNSREKRARETKRRRPAWA